MIQNRMISSIFLCKTKLHIIIGICGFCMDLPPDTCFYHILLIGMDQVTESMPAIGKEIIKILTAGKSDQLLIGKQDPVILRIRLIDQECTGQMARNIPQCKTETASFPCLQIFLIRKTTMLSLHFYLIKCPVRVL